MEMRQRQMEQFLTPQHPSSMQRSHWGNQPQEFMTPQHPAMGIPESPRFGTPHRQGRRRRHHPGQFGTPPNPAAFGAKALDWGGEPRQFRSPAQAAVRKNYWGTIDGNRPFGTPLRHHAFPDFRTPQHPSQGTNNWGNASPLLARNIPQESLDAAYERLYTVRTLDEMLMTGEGDHDDDDGILCPRIEAVKYVHKDPPTATPNPNLRRRRGMLWRFIKWKPRDQNPPAVQDNSMSQKKKGWLPRFGLQKGRPTGPH